MIEFQLTRAAFGGYHPGGLGGSLREVTMLKISAPGLTALFITASLQTYAQVPDAGAADRLTATGFSALADPRFNLSKGYMRSDQEIPWPTRLWSLLSEEEKPTCSNVWGFFW
jgi:hypothetical protein